MTEEVDLLRDKVTGLEAELRSALIGRALEAAAAEARAVAPAQAAVLLRQELNLDLDENRNVVVRGPDGNPLLDQAGRPVTLARAAAEWLSGNPHLLLPAGRSGSGTPAGAAQEDQAFTPEQLADPAFYRANRDRIHKFFNRR